MCGRYVLVSKVCALGKELQLDMVSGFDPCYNAFPGKEMPVILSSDPKIAQNVKWGLVPSWSRWKDMNYYYNAFVSDIVKHPAYKIPIRKSRCLVLANCFYVWIIDQNNLKIPHVVYVKSQRILTFAGVFDVRIDKMTGEQLKTFAIITTYSNKRMSKIFPTMPAIIPPSRRNKYLKNSLPLNEVMQLLKPFETDQINLYPVSLKVNDPLNDDKEIIQPMGERVFKEFTYVPKTSSRFY